MVGGRAFTSDQGFGNRVWYLILSRAAHPEVCATAVESFPGVKTLRLPSASLECHSLRWGPRICILTRFPGDSDAQPGVGTLAPLGLTGWMLQALHHLTCNPISRSSSSPCCNGSAHHSCYTAAASLPLVPFFCQSLVPKVPLPSLPLEIPQGPAQCLAYPQSLCLIPQCLA